MKSEFKPFRKSMSGGVKWANKPKEYREYARKEATRKATTQAKPMDNRFFSKCKDFIRNCEEHGIKPTKRQASRFRNRTGSLYKAMKQ